MSALPSIQAGEAMTTPRRKEHSRPFRLRWRGTGVRPAPDAALEHDWREVPDKVPLFVQGQRWQVLWSGASNKADQAGLIDVARDTLALIIMVEYGHLAPALKLLKDLTATRQPLPLALVAMLVCVPRDATPEIVVETQRSLLAAGAEDVVIEAGDPESVRFAVAMSIERACQQRKERQTWQAKLQKAQQAAEEDVQGCEEVLDLFWRHAHHISEAVPKVDNVLPTAPAPGAKVGPCTLESVLGEGAFGKVFHAANCETQEHEAVKVIDKGHLCNVEAFRAFTREMVALRRLDHPNIAKLRGAHHGPTHMFIRMEMAGHLNLSTVIKQSGSLPAQTAAAFFLQLLAAVTHCHAHGLAHRDIKPKNIAVDDERITLVDFGLATCATSPSHARAGTMPFMAPEVLLATRAHPYEPTATDAWSCGVVLLEMICGVGKLNKMLGWPEPARPHPQRGLELADFLKNLDPIEAAVREQLWPSSAQEELPEPEHFGHLAALLRGLLAGAREDRWSVETALESQWMSALFARDSHDPEPEPAVLCPTVPGLPKPARTRPLSHVNTRAVAADI